VSKSLPATLVEAIRYFDDIDVCTQFVAEIRWPDGPVCPDCGGTEHSYLTTRRLWKCKACKRQFSVKVGTIFEDSSVKLKNWLAAIWLITNSKNGISSYELGKAIGVQQRTAWFMNHRIRLAMQMGTFDRIEGETEIDETFVGGKAKNKKNHERAARKARYHKSGVSPFESKALVVGARNRDAGTVAAEVVSNRTAKTLLPFVRKTVAPGSTIYTDSWSGYNNVAADGYTHEVIDHVETYVQGAVHTNGIENFWSLLKRSLHGTYVAVNPEHLFRYVDERVFSYNLRDLNDYDRFRAVLQRVTGRRLTYAELTGT
jgi:transposase-like protein